MAKHIYKAQSKKIRRISDEAIDTSIDSPSTKVEREAIQAELKALLDDIEQALDDC